MDFLTRFDSLMLEYLYVIVFFSPKCAKICVKKDMVFDFGKIKMWFL